MYAISFTPNGLAIQGVFTQRQVNEYKVLQEQSSKKTCHILPEMLTEDRHLWY